MEYTRLGSTGLRVSKICFGTWRFGMETDGVIETDREEAFDLLDAAWEQGINFIDTANVYGVDSASEQWIGEWLNSRDVDRQEVVIASKVYWTSGPVPGSDLSRKTIREEIEGTLDRLDTDYIDVYYIHRWDEDTPIRETLTALNGLIDEGKVNYIAASSMDAWKLTKAVMTSQNLDIERFEVTQPKFNAATRPESYLDVCADQDLAVCPWSPLEAGLLTGKYERGAEYPEGSRGDLVDWDPDERFSDRQWRVLEAVEAVADEVDATPAQVSLRWLMDQREFDCVPIIGARTVDQIEENAGAAEVALSDEQYDRIDQAYHEA
ncbi:MAG: aldo/keto reductase [Halobacteriaceae archaeon]